MQEQFQSTIPVEEWNDHQTEAETCKAWLMSEVGIDTKEKNPAGYMNVVTHMQEHDKFVQQAAAAEMAAQGAQNGPETGKSSGDSKPTPGGGRD
jgi:hypothetical protein